MVHICNLHFFLFSAIFLFLACVIYPSGWDNEELRKICGDNSGRYRMGDCNMRWAYILAILGIFDAAILAVLAFFLASKRAKIEMYTSSGAVTKCKLFLPLVDSSCVISSFRHNLIWKSLPIFITTPYVYSSFILTQTNSISWACLPHSSTEHNEKKKTSTTFKLLRAIWHQGCN